ncbi:lasso peptide isopeptide bond-forming cyclase [Streptomyces halobius]|uniref:asparagine synthase (glutamine-hydrolyzing) n=1 Tax=Streptomyces halobius TaxID=2879846 RepID=A0ABY4M4C7_9ACTN|nr:lasso peptide isopeptide bond-forming cyclase [Streptomyces halobius]UQA92317.1 lasso peptide isopeptide bond-forming cyclase [Streptomyces halobius]
MPTSYETGGVGPGDAHFAVLPDCADAVAAARSFRRPEARTLAHPSGRPWLVGRWSDQEIVTAHAGWAAIAVVGCCPVGPDELKGYASRLRDLTELDALARRLSGSFHLVAALDGRQRVQGTASGLRLVFHAAVDGVRVAATSADELAAAIGEEPDEERLAVRLLWPAPYPLSETSLWRGVTAVPPEDALIVAPDGRTARHSRWWTPPDPVRSLAENAPLVREALSDAVDARTSAGGVVSCDLSGGLDSTSVCFLAARSPAHVVASTWPGRDPADSDLYWAQKAAGFLPDVEHVIWDADESPLVYDDLLAVDDLIDEPTIGVMDRSRVLHHLPALGQRGSRLHLTGIGGDHVAWCSEAYYHRLIRTRPLLALRHLRGFRTLFHWPLGATARALADSRSYGQWLAHAGRQLREAKAPPVSGTLGWGSPPRLFDWITPETARIVGRALRDAAESAQPLHPDRGMHADLEQIRVCTRIVRQWDRMAARAGVPMASPFFDDRVIEACLAVNPVERVTPWAYKPLLTAAMRQIVPDVCLERANKAQASMDATNGLRERRGDLMELWEDSHLARLGLVDGRALMELARRPSTPGLNEGNLYSTIACEVWLRSLSRKRREVSSG